MEKLQQTQSDLQKREDILRSAQTELEQRSVRLKELEVALQQKDDAVKQLRQKVMDALLGFNNKGLTIQEKNGKVYVSLDEHFYLKQDSGRSIRKDSRRSRIWLKCWAKIRISMFWLKAIRIMFPCVEQVR